MKQYDFGPKQLNATTIKHLEMWKEPGNKRKYKIYFFNKDIKSIAPNIFDCYKSLQELDLSCNLITHFPPRMLHGLPELRSFDASINNIVALDEDLFAHNPQIHSIDLSRNQLTIVNPDVFRNLPRLIALHINGNQIKSFSFESVKSSSRLIELYFDDNQISEVDGFKNFQHWFPSLSIVSLNKNHFEKPYLQELINTLERQEVSISDIDKTAGIQDVSVYGLGCVNTEANEYLKTKNERLTAEVNALKEENAKLLKEKEDEVLFIRKTTNGKIEEYEARIGRLKQTADEERKQMTKMIYQLQTNLDMKSKEGERTNGQDLSVATVHEEAGVSHLSVDITSKLEMLKNMLGRLSPQPSSFFVMRNLLLLWHKVNLFLELERRSNDNNNNTI